MLPGHFTASEVSVNLMAEYSVGSMSYSCSFCDAKFWDSEISQTALNPALNFLSVAGSPR